jgi:hypothetical protein
MPAALRRVWTSVMSAVPNASFGGQVRSGETHCCHEIRSVDPNDALFTHGALVALPFRAAVRSAKKCATVACETVKGFGLDDPVETEAEPSDRTSIRYPSVLVEPESTMTALSSGTAPIKKTAA